MNMIKNKDEIKNIREACRIAAKTWEIVEPQIKIGRSEREIADEIISTMLKLGADKKPESFPTIVAVGSNSATAHHETGNRKVKQNSVVLVDFGCRFNGYCSDMTRTIFFGEPTNLYIKIKKAVDTAYITAVNLLTPGVRVSDVDRAARDVITEAGYGKQFIHTTGHGLGLKIHEPPNIYLKSKNRLKAGMAITIEPGIYLPGKFGYRYENTLIVTRLGSENMTTLYSAGGTDPVGSK